MEEHRVTLPTLGLLAATRGMIGFGAGLLLAQRFASKRRRAVGWSLLIAGALSTIPLMVRLFRNRRTTDNEEPTTFDRDPWDAEAVIVMAD